MSEDKAALDVQVAGNHYKSMAIQPVEFCQKNNLNFCESSVIKYVCRHRNKNGLEDLKKARHFIDLLISLEYSKHDDGCCETHNIAGCRSKGCQ